MHSKIKKSPEQKVSVSPIMLQCVSPLMAHRDRSHLRPDACGPQHDAREPGWFGGRLKWPEALRRIDPDAILHQSVYDRFAADKVQHFYHIEPYRPKNLANHKNLRQYYP